MVRRKKCFGSPTYSRKHFVLANKTNCKLLKQASNGYQNNQIPKSFFLHLYIDTASSNLPRVVDLKLPIVWAEGDRIKDCIRPYYIVEHGAWDFLSLPKNKLATQESMSGLQFFLFTESRCNNHVTQATPVVFMLSVFISGDLILQCCFLYTRGMSSFAKKVEAFLWQIATVFGHKDCWWE